ncbi:MAG: divalent-cation tolerance protein CutA [Chloroflexota bacterium]
MTSLLQVMTTTNSQESANAIARAVLEHRLAACVQVIGPIQSTFWWNGECQISEEWLLFIKTGEHLYSALEDAILALHPYDVPEILATQIVAGNRRYVAWLEEQIQPVTAGPHLPGM